MRTGSLRTLCTGQLNKWRAPSGTAVPARLHPAAILAGVSIDSRTVAPGELFIAIQGPRSDGHEYVCAAFESGAPAAVVSFDRAAGYPEAVRAKVFTVADTLAALQTLAQAVRRAWGRRIAAVTGSAGKTTTKEILAALLSAELRVLKSEGNFNNEYGLPLTLLRLEPEHQSAVVEMGMSHAGELRRLAQIAEPEVGVVTCVAPVHLEFFSSIDDIARAKRELIEGLTGDPRASAAASSLRNESLKNESQMAPQIGTNIAAESAMSGAHGSVAVLNADDARVAAFADVAPGRVLTYGFAESAQFRAVNVANRGAQGSAFDFHSPEGTVRLDLPLPGRHNISNALAALAAASVWGIGAQVAARVFPQMDAGEMRGRILRFAAGFALINDSYNSNPTALRAMMELLAHTAGYRRRILAAGEMLELGSQAPMLHREIGEYAAALNLDWVLGAQGDAAEIVYGAIEAGMSPGRARFFETSTKAAEFLAEMIEPGDLVLVKGSRGVKMERVVEMLSARYPLAATQTQAAPAPGATQPGRH